jgi:hypothetical protein
MDAVSDGVSVLEAVMDNVGVVDTVSDGDVEEEDRGTKS